MSCELVTIAISRTRYTKSPCSRHDLNHSTFILVYRNITAVLRGPEGARWVELGNSPPPAAQKACAC
jgi:hypothetical protein